MSITAANVGLVLAIDTIFPLPQQVQGFGPDDIYNVPSIKTVEVVIGVDGVLSAGFVFAMVPMTITLQADSESNALFDAWYNQMQAAEDVYEAQGQIRLPSISTRFVMTTGFLTGYVPVPPGKRTLGTRTYELTWNKVVSTPIL